jgi:DNA segregation ATPase FtsK/SpoIIIE, S-DNA-T family
MAKRRRTTTTVTRRRRAARGTMKFEVKSSVMREISAVIYLALGVFTWLSLNNNFGLVGEIWISLLNPILGWGVKLMPFVFAGAALLLFFSKRVSFTLSRLLGIFLLLVAVLSILHLSVPMDSIYSEAKLGNYGGYIGFVANFVFRQLLNVGYVGAAAVFFTIFLIGFLLTFQISIVSFLSFFRPQIKLVRKKKEAVEDEEEPKVKKIIEDEEALNELTEEEKLSDEDLENEKFRMHGGDGEVVTIKRPVIMHGEEKPKERKIHIIEEDDDKPISEMEHDEYAGWETPSLDLLNPAVADITSDDALLQENAKKIREKLQQFGLEVEMHEVHVGPTVIQYTLRPHEGIKLSKITGLKNDLALALAAKSIRIEAPIPGKSLVGVEVPNDHRSLVHLREILESKEYGEIKSNLRVPIGRDVSGKPVIGDLGAMPHLLVAGATGSGKSVGMNTFLLSLIYQNSPHDLKLIMIDPKRVELTGYNGIPHLLTPVVTDPEKAAIALRWAVAEMNKRYQLCAENRHKNIEEFNTCAEVHEEGRETPGHERMPNIVIVVDELADLMMAAGKEVEASICRIAQMARAVGIHLIIATQRPSVDVITGLIKANIPSRIAFAVSSQIDSRTILDGAGAEDLLGKGDMLYMPGGMSKPVRVQGIFVSSKEIDRVTNYAKIAFPPSYLDDIISPRVAQQKVQGIPQSDLGDADDDELYEQAMQVIRESRKASASLLQRRLKLGYARAARLLDLMEQNGAIGPVNGAKAREIYIE